MVDALNACPNENGIQGGPAGFQRKAALRQSVLQRSLEADEHPIIRQCEATCQK
jgi:hypothetical protein